MNDILFPKPKPKPMAFHKLRSSREIVPDLLEDFHSSLKVDKIDDSFVFKESDLEMNRILTYNTSIHKEIFGDRIEDEENGKNPKESKFDRSIKTPIISVFRPIQTQKLNSIKKKVITNLKEEKTM